MGMIFVCLFSGLVYIAFILFCFVFLHRLSLYSTGWFQTPCSLPSSPLKCGGGGRITGLSLQAQLEAWIFFFTDAQNAFEVLKTRIEGNRMIHDQLKDKWHLFNFYYTFSSHTITRMVFISKKPQNFHWPGWILRNASTNRLWGWLISGLLLPSVILPSELCQHIVMQR